jgi:hypothetical protein
MIFCVALWNEKKLGVLDEISIIKSGSGRRIVGCL